MTRLIGFSTFGRRIGSTTLQDKDIAIRDIQNHFYTRKGERLGEPEFGSDLPLLVFEPFDQRTVDLIEEDIINVIDSDPRWEFRNHRVEESDHIVIVRVLVNYVPDSSPEELVLNYRATEEI